VFEHRAASDAVVVGGNTLRRDNPRLTTRRDSGHLPVRVVMSRTLDLPDAANLWDTQVGTGGLYKLGFAVVVLVGTASAVCCKHVDGENGEGEVWLLL
jgi:hypothetical protein